MYTFCFKEVGGTYFLNLGVTGLMKVCKYSPTIIQMAHRRKVGSDSMTNMNMLMAMLTTGNRGTHGTMNENLTEFCGWNISISVQTTTSKPNSPASAIRSASGRSSLLSHVRKQTQKPSMQSTRMVVITLTMKLVRWLGCGGQLGCGASAGLGEVRVGLGKVRVGLGATRVGLESGRAGPLNSWCSFLSQSALCGRSSLLTSGRYRLSRTESATVM